MRLIFAIIALAWGCNRAPQGNSTHPPDMNTAHHPSLDIEIQAYAFVSWNEQRFPERFQAVPQTSLLIPGDKPGLIRDDFRIRTAGKDRLLIAGGNRIYLVEPGTKSPLATMAPVVDGPKNDLVDFCGLYGKVFALVREEDSFLIKQFAADGNALESIPLSLNDEAKSYEKLLDNGEELFVVGSGSPAATFLVSPTLYRVSGNTARRVSGWKDQNMHNLFMSGAQEISYVKQIDRKLFCTRYDLENRQETFRESQDSSAWPFLKLPIGLPDPGRMLGRSGRSVGLVKTEDNSLLGTVQLDNLFLHNGQVFYCSLEEAGLRVGTVQGRQFTEKAVLKIPPDDAPLQRIRNWKLEGIPAEGGWLVSGFAPGQALVYLRYGEDGDFQGRASTPPRLGHRLSPPEFWFTSGADTYAGSSGPDGLQVFVLRF